MDEYVACDGPRCGARAYVFASSGESQLAYCAHHGTKYWASLCEFADSIVDMRHLVNA